MKNEVKSERIIPKDMFSISTDSKFKYNNLMQLIFNFSNYNSNMDVQNLSIHS